MRNSKTTINPFRQLKVLIADPDVYLARIVEDILRAAGVTSVAMSHTYNDARMLLRGMNLDALIADWIWEPGREDGWSLLDEVRLSPESPKPELPIVLCTAHAEYNQIVEARDRGASEIIIKPVAPAQLVQKLQSAVYKPRPFISTAAYTGPDRRRRRLPWDAGERRRRPALDQAAVDALMHQKYA
jgi:two-component system chemotaxis response regulator CheY